MARQSFWKENFRIKDPIASYPQVALNVLPLGLALVIAALFLTPTKAFLGALVADTANAGRGKPLWRRLRIAVGAYLASQFFLVLGMHSEPYFIARWAVVIIGTALIMGIWNALDLGKQGCLSLCLTPAFGVYLGIVNRPLAEVLSVNALVWLLAITLGLALTIAEQRRKEITAVAATVAAGQEYWNHADSVVASKPVLQRCSESFGILRDGHTTRQLRANSKLQELQALLLDTYNRTLTVIAQRWYGAAQMYARSGSSNVILGDPKASYVLSQARLRGSHARRIAFRVVVALSVVEFVAVLIPESHSYWAVIAAMAVLFQSNDRYATAVRSSQRVLGTAIGLGFYILISLFVHEAWWKLLLFIIARYGIEALSPRNYGLGSICITVYGLLLLPVSADLSLTSILEQRLGETILGVSVGFAVVWLFHDERRLLRRQTMNLVQSMQALYFARFYGTSQLHLAELRRNVFFEIWRYDQLVSLAAADKMKDAAQWRLLADQLWVTAMVVIVYSRHEDTAGEHAMLKQLGVNLLVMSECEQPETCRLELAEWGRNFLVATQAKDLRTIVLPS